MSSSATYYLDEFWRNNGHPSSKSLILTQIPPYILIGLIGLYFFALRLARNIRSNCAWNYSPILIPYFGFFFGCYFVGEFVALLVANWGRIIFECGNTVQDFNSLIINYLSFMFFAFQTFHLMDSVLMVLAGQEKMVTGAHRLEKVILVLRGYLDLKFYPTGVGAAYAILVSVINTINYSYLIRHFASTELRPKNNWQRQVTFLRFVLYLALTGHSIYALNLSDETCDSPSLLRVSQLVTSVIMLLAYGKEFFCHSCQTSQTGDKKKRH